MNARTRRKLEMGARALEFSRTHKDASPGYTAAVDRLADLLARADQLETQQREGIIQSRNARARKQELVRIMKAAHLAHVSSIAQIVEKENPELVGKFTLPKETSSYHVFRTAARVIESEALAHKELLVKHGLSEPVLQGLTASLDELDSVIRQGDEGRVAHVGASFEIEQVGGQVVDAVTAMKGLNRVRFSRDGELLASWKAASTVYATPRPTDQTTDPVVTPPTTPDVRPAA
jgi:hypothetical protein